VESVTLEGLFRKHGRRTADGLLLLVLSVASVALWVPRWAGPLDLRWDGAVYYVLGTSIAEGKGYRLLNEPGEIEAIQYPPLLPLLAAAPQAALGTSDPVIVGGWLKLFFFSFQTAFVLATYFMLKLLVPRWAAFLGALALLLNVQVVFHSNLFFAEMPFGLVTVLFVLCNRRSGHRLHDALSAVLGVTAFTLRTAGVALLAAWVAESLARKQFKRAAVRLVISAIPVLTWNAYIFHVERSPSYTTPAYPYQRAPYLNYNVSYATNLALVDLYSPDSSTVSARQLAHRFWFNVRGIGVTLGEAVSESRGFWQYQLSSYGQRYPVLKAIPRRAIYIPLVLLGGLALGGMVVLLGRGEIFVPVYISTSIVLMCATPVPEQFRRYLVPVAPFLLASLFSGALALASWLRASPSSVRPAAGPDRCTGRAPGRPGADPRPGADEPEPDVPESPSRGAVRDVRRQIRRLSPLLLHVRLQGARRRSRLAEAAREARRRRGHRDAPLGLPQERIEGGEAARRIDPRAHAGPVGFRSGRLYRPESRQRRQGDQQSCLPVRPRPSADLALRACGRRESRSHLRAGTPRRSEDSTGRMSVSGPRAGRGLVRREPA
jgi:hypothetical protein